MKTIEIKPCPLCGNKNIKVFSAFGTHVSCEKCNLKCYDFDMKSAIRKWDKRAKNE